MKPLVWKAFAALASAGAAVAARNAVTAVWKRRMHADPPNNPADPATAWGEAIAWTLGLGAFAGLARLLARRGAAKVWEQVDGDLPPALQEGG